MTVTNTLAAALLCCAMLWGGGCLPQTTEASFIAGASELRCDGVYPVCRGKYAGCVMDEDTYMRGSFPGARKFLVRTKSGDWSIRVKLFLDKRLAPGSETELSWYEPGCADQYRYELSRDDPGTDLFEKAGRDQTFDVEQAVVESGDHLLEIFSDATCEYVLKVEVVPQQ